MEFKVGECVVITLPKDSIYYKYYNGLTGNVVEFSNKYGNRYLVQTDAGSFYMYEEYLCHTEEDENIKIEDIFSIM